MDMDLSTLESLLDSVSEFNQELIETFVAAHPDINYTSILNKCVPVRVDVIKWLLNNGADPLFINAGDTTSSVEKILCILVDWMHMDYDQIAISNLITSLHLFCSYIPTFPQVLNGLCNKNYTAEILGCIPKYGVRKISSICKLMIEYGMDDNSIFIQLFRNRSLHRGEVTDFCYEMENWITQRALAHAQAKKILICFSLPDDIIQLLFTNSNRIGYL